MSFLISSSPKLCCISEAFKENGEITIHDCSDGDAFIVKHAMRIDSHAYIADLLAMYIYVYIYIYRCVCIYRQ